MEKYHDYFVSYQDIRNVFDEEDISKIYFVMSDLDNNVIGDIIAEVLGGVKEFHAAVLVLSPTQSRMSPFTSLTKNCS